MPSTLKRLSSLSIKVYSTITNMGNVAYKEYMRNQAIRKRAGYSAFLNFGWYAKLHIILREPQYLPLSKKRQYQNPDIRSAAIIKTSKKLENNAPYKSLFLSYRRVNTPVLSKIPYTAEYESRKEITNRINAELDQVELFYAQLQNDLRLAKKPKKIVNDQISTLFGELLSTDIWDSISELENRIKELKRNRNTAVNYSSIPGVTQRSGYQTFLTLCEIAHKKTALEHTAKPSLAASYKDITEKNVIDLFPVNSHFRRYIELTQTWWGFIKSYVPFTEAFEVSMQLSIEINDVIDFIEYANDNIDQLLHNNLLAKNKSQHNHIENSRYNISTSKAIRSLKASGASPRTAADNALKVQDDLVNEQTHLANLSTPTSPVGSQIERKDQRDTSKSQVSENHKNPLKDENISPTLSTESSPDKQLMTNNKFNVPIYSPPTVQI